jgi:hypothetical protein
MPTYSVRLANIFVLRFDLMLRTRYTPRRAAGPVFAS